MIDYTYKNHLQYSIGNRPFGFRETIYDKYELKIGAVNKEQYEKSNYADELHRIADLVYNSFSKDFVIFLSGGTDSEIVARNFVGIGVKPTCVTLRFENDLNASEVAEAVAIANELNLKHVIIDFNVREFYNSGEAAELATSVQCCQITYLMMYRSIQKLGTAVIAGGEIPITRQVTKDGFDWFVTYRENEDASAMRFSMKYNIPFIQEWFTYTPEILLYYLEDTRIQDLVTQRYNYKLSSVSSKNVILRSLYPNIRPKFKKHGFENLLAFNHEAYVELGKNLIKRAEPSLDGIPVSRALEMLKVNYGI